MVMAEPRFEGFAAAAVVAPIPAVLLHELVPRMTDPAELLVTLYAVAALQRVRRFPRLISAADLRSERALVEALAAMAPDRTVDAALEDGLAAAAARGTLLRSSDAQAWVALNSADGRRAIAHRAQLVSRPTPQPTPRGVGVIELYEDAIGPLPPSLAEELHSAAASYPEPWVAEAFAEAVQLNKRSWRYVRRILERWEREGRDSASTRAPRGQSGESRFNRLIQR